jgi:hypothetical protein
MYCTIQYVTNDKFYHRYLPHKNDLTVPFCVWKKPNPISDPFFRIRQALQDSIHFKLSCNLSVSFLTFLPKSNFNHSDVLFSEETQVSLRRASSQWPSTAENFSE